jgi:hypothetical protein
MDSTFPWPSRLLRPKKFLRQKQVAQNSPDEPLISLHWQAAVASITQITQNIPAIDTSPRDHGSEDARYDTSKTCCICIVAYEKDGERAVKLACGHIYGNQCIQIWLLDQTTCPSCRKYYEDKLIWTKSASHPFLENETKDFMSAFNQDLSFFKSCPPRKEHPRASTTFWDRIPSDRQFLEFMNLNFPVPHFTFNRVERTVISDTRTISSLVKKQG